MEKYHQYTVRTMRSNKRRIVDDLHWPIKEKETDSSLQNSVPDNDTSTENESGSLLGRSLDDG